MATSANPSTKHLSELQKLAAALGVMAPPRAPSLAGTASSEPPSVPAKPAASAPESSPAAPDPGTGNAAVDRCLAAYSQAYRKARAAGRSDYEGERAGKAAYKRAMPPLVGGQNVADFIACVTRALIEDILLGVEISHFLYAAQIANCVKNPAVIPAPKRPRGRPSKAKSSVLDPNPEDDSSVNTQTRI